MTINCARYVKRRKGSDYEKYGISKTMEILWEVTIKTHSDIMANTYPCSAYNMEMLRRAIMANTVHWYQFTECGSFPEKHERVYVKSNHVSIM